MIKLPNLISFSVFFIFILLKMYYGTFITFIVGLAVKGKIRVVFKLTRSIVL